MFTVWEHEISGGRAAKCSTVYLGSVFIIIGQVQEQIQGWGWRALGAEAPLPQWAHYMLSSIVLPSQSLFVCACWFLALSNLSGLNSFESIHGDLCRCKWNITGHDPKYFACIQSNSPFTSILDPPYSEACITPWNCYIRLIRSSHLASSMQLTQVSMCAPRPYLESVAVHPQSRNLTRELALSTFQESWSVPCSTSQLSNSGPVPGGPCSFRVWVITAYSVAKTTQYYGRL